MRDLYKELLEEFRAFNEEHQFEHTNASFNQGFDTFVRVRLFEIARDEGPPVPSHEAREQMVKVLNDDNKPINITSDWSD